jgi:hypothetical protein
MLVLSANRIIVNSSSPAIFRKQSRTARRTKYSFSGFGADLVKTGQLRQTWCCQRSASTLFGYRANAGLPVQLTSQRWLCTTTGEAHLQYRWTTTPTPVPPLDVRYTPNDSMRYTRNRIAAVFPGAIGPAVSPSGTISMWTKKLRRKKMITDTHIHRALRLASQQRQ